MIDARSAAVRCGSRQTAMYENQRGEQRGPPSLSADRHQSVQGWGPPPAYEASVLMWGGIFPAFVEMSGISLAERYCQCVCFSNQLDNASTHRVTFKSKGATCDCARLHTTAFLYIARAGQPTRRSRTVRWLPKFQQEEKRRKQAVSLQPNQKTTNRSMERILLFEKKKSSEQESLKAAHNKKTCHTSTEQEITLQKALPKQVRH